MTVALKASLLLWSAEHLLQPRPKVQWLWAISPTAPAIFGRDGEGWGAPNRDSLHMFNLPENFVYRHSIGGCIHCGHCSVKVRLDLRSKKNVKSSHLWLFGQCSMAQCILLHFTVKGLTSRRAYWVSCHSVRAILLHSEPRNCTWSKFTEHMSTSRWNAVVLEHNYGSPHHSCPQQPWNQHWRLLSTRRSWIGRACWWPKSNQSCFLKLSCLLLVSLFYLDTPVQRSFKWIFPTYSTQNAEWQMYPREPRQEKYVHAGRRRRGRPKNGRF